VTLADNYEYLEEDWARCVTVLYTSCHSTVYLLSQYCIPPLSFVLSRLLSSLLMSGGAIRSVTK